MDVAALENSIGYRFGDRTLAERALTHRSWGHERSRTGVGDGGDAANPTEHDNETLEFLGDSVLGLAIAEELFRRHPERPEGELTLMKHSLVSLKVLAEIAEGLGLGEHMRLGRGEEHTGGRRKSALLADTLEAVIGAVFLDAGYEAARDMVARLFAEHLGRATPETSIDYKTLLQEVLQAAKLKAPVYTLTATDGPPHDRTFAVEAAWEGGATRGEGRSIKAAEMAAARAALDVLDAGKISSTEA